LSINSQIKNEFFGLFCDLISLKNQTIWEEEAGKRSENLQSPPFGQEIIKLPFRVWIRMFPLMRVAIVEIGSDKHVARNLGSNR